MFHYVASLLGGRGGARWFASATTLLYALAMVSRQTARLT